MQANVSPRKLPSNLRPLVEPDRQKLERMVLSCMLREPTFYEAGDEIAARIRETVDRLVEVGEAAFVADLAVKARREWHLRHVPLALVAMLADTRKVSGTGLLRDVTAAVIGRPDEAAELLAFYWGGKSRDKKKLPNAIKRGIADAHAKFDRHQFAKYDRDKPVKLRDAMFLAHPKPPAEPDDAKTTVTVRGGHTVTRHLEGAGATYTALADRTLEPADTWEAALSSGADKRETFERLLREGRLGYLALLRNLRNMHDAGVDRELVSKAILARRGARQVLPFRYVAAARAAPAWRPELNAALTDSLDFCRLEGTTAVLVDVSGSMNASLSAKSDLTRMDAAAALGGLLACVSGRTVVYSFSDRCLRLWQLSRDEARRRGPLELADQIVRSQPHCSTALHEALEAVRLQEPDATRLVVVSDEIATDAARERFAQATILSYMLDVGGYPTVSDVPGEWVRIGGFSEAILSWMMAREADARRRGSAL